MAAAGTVLVLLIGGLGYSIYSLNTPENLNPVASEIEEEIRAFASSYSSTTDSISGIEVTRVEGMADDSYIVEGEAQTPGGSYPATLRLLKVDGQWTVLGFEKSQASPTSNQVTVEGTWECLPHRGNGPQTDECAFGVLLDGAHFAVGTEHVTHDPVELAVGARVRIVGVMVPIYEDSVATLKYSINGIIDATSIQKI